MKVVIVGAVAAGPKAACRVKRLLPNAEVILVDQDDLISYGGCGIPYFVSGDVSDEKELRSTSYHLVRDEGYFENAKGVKTITSTRCLSIDRKAKAIEVENLKTGERYTISYDKLVLATGSQPRALPIPGSDCKGVFSVASLHKAIEIKRSIEKGEVSQAVIVGGGAIGLEMAEGLADLWGIETTVIEVMPQILPRIVSPVFARMVMEHMKEHNVQVLTEEYAKELVADENGRVVKVITNKRELPAQLVITAAGVLPRGELARAAGLHTSAAGAIVVNQRMQTSDPDIYAAGDCVELLNLVTGKKGYAPMGSIANRQGRVVGDNIAGIPSTFSGCINSFVMKIFDLAVGATGISLEVARAEGFDVFEVFCVQSDRAHFFPTQRLMFLNMVVDRRTNRVLGLQGVGQMGDGLMARINAAAGLIERRAVVSDFSNLELAYAPPFSTAVDILNAVANVADNVLSGRMTYVSPLEFVAWMNGEQEHSDWMVLDLRHIRESEPYVKQYSDRWMAIPYNEVRNNYEKLPNGKTLILLCNAGTRAYEVQVFLRSIGLTDTLVLTGGLNVINRLKPAWLL
ncbi:MAG: FAD-dependent oxidoreductase [Dissulfuribacterales bacterium]